MNTFQQTITLAGRIGVEQAKTYVHLPFEMPGDATRLDIEFEYSHRIGSSPLLEGGNTIDLGIFDARGIDFLNAGFRGWTGSERLTFFISETDATPGYLAGALIPGRWHLLLGLYKIAPEGCEYTVVITISSQPGHQSTEPIPGPVPEFATAPVLPREGGWLRGELHCHTYHSDGDGDPVSLVRMARERGLDFLAITDHNTISCQRELAQLYAPGILLIRGVEVTTFKGHFNVWGVGDWIDFRVLRAQDMTAAIRFAVERGAVTTCNHPKPFGPPWEYPEVEGYHCIEVWNGPWYEMNQSALDFWTERLAQGKRIVAIGGSDYHRRSQLLQDPPRALGTPTVWVYVPETADAAAILNAIRRGHVSLSDEPEGPFLDLRAETDTMAMAGDTMRPSPSGRLTVRAECHRGAGFVLQLFDHRKKLFEQALTQPQTTVRAALDVRESMFVRAELRDPADNVRALTNPIYLDFAPSALIDKAVSQHYNNHAGR